MYRRMVRILAIGAVATAMTALAGEANAHWRWCGSSGGSWGSNGSWGSYGSHGSWGSSGGYYRHVHYRARYHGSHGSWGSYGSYGGSWGSYGSYGSSGGYIVPQQQAPPQQQQETPEPPEPGATEGDEAYYGGSAILTVNVPADARVLVNNALTRTAGTERRYISRSLAPGYSYTYTVKAQIERDGRAVEETKTVELRAGGSARLTFALDTPPTTTLTLHVPDNAQVYLAGNATKSSGAVRTFTTRALPAGQEWSNYEIRVMLESEGQMLTKTETISLKSGESREMTIALDDARIASAK